MIIRFNIKNELGEYFSDKMEVTEEQYKNIIEMSKTFYNSGYDMYLENGFIVVPPDMVKKSILIIEIVN